MVIGDHAVVIDVLAAEWLKTWTVRSTYVLIGIVCAFVGLCALLAWYVALLWDGMTSQERTQVALTPLTEVTSWVAALCLALFGVLAITSEYTTGTIRVTFAAVPARRTILLAKALVVATVAMVTGQAAVFTTFFLGRLIIGDRPIRGQPDGVAGELPQLLASGASVTMFALIGLGLGALTRSAVKAITIVAVAWYLLPMVVHNVPAPWNDRIGSVLPGALAGQLAGTGNEHSVAGALLSPFWALVMMVGYLVVPVGAAAVLVNRRDA